ncbi:MAG: hypothetical protein RLZZ331_1790, partial [Pseudomonadota bacterium]
MTFKTILALATGLTIFAVPALAADTKPQIGTFGFDVPGMDISVKAGDDFVGHTAGKYMAALEIPADKTNFGMFTKLRDLSQERTRAIIEKAAASAGAPGSEAQKVGDFFASLMDEAAIEAKGIAPLKPQLDAIAAIASKADYAELVGRNFKLGVPGPI